jgi:hypothetical protein
MWMDVTGKKAGPLVLVTVHGSKRVTNVSLCAGEYLLSPEEATGRCGYRSLIIQAGRLGSVGLNA